MVKKSQKGKAAKSKRSRSCLPSHHLPSTRRNEEPASGNTPDRNMSSFHLKAQSLEDSQPLWQYRILLLSDSSDSGFSTNTHVKSLLVALLSCILSLVLSLVKFGFRYSDVFGTSDSANTDFLNLFHDFMIFTTAQGESWPGTLSDRQKALCLCDPGNINIWMLNDAQWCQGWCSLTRVNMTENSILCHAAETDRACSPNLAVI